MAGNDNPKSLMTTNDNDNDDNVRTFYLYITPILIMANSPQLEIKLD
jgi:hypothetical protein